MEWFKHDTGASTDAKMRKLIMRHGAIGYAVYFHCLELIMADVNKNNITFQLEHDSEIIADNLKITGNGTESGVDIVEKIMHTLINLGLFESNCNKITCVKLLIRLDSSMTSNSIFRDKIKATKNNNVMIPSCLSHDTVMQEKNRTEEEENKKKKRIEEDKEIDKEINTREHFNKLWLMYPRERRPDSKKNVTSKTKKILFNISEKEWQRVLDRYKKEYPDYKFWKHCFRFMNNETFNIYLDVNYVEPKQTTNSKPDKWKGDQNFDF